MDTARLKEEAQRYIQLEQHPQFRQEVEELLSREDYAELDERFYTSLTFGTGGLRGIIGGGYNRLNTYTIKKATQGLAQYITETTSEGSVVIAYDSRNYSDIFAKEAAKTLAGNGIQVYLFSSLRPVPELSFAVRQLKTTAGIVITASHNPAQYNGYKVYWSDGCQVTAPHDEKIVAYANNATDIITGDDAEDTITLIDAEIDEPYIEMVKGLSLRPELMAEKGKDLTVVYSPLHGAGKMPLERALSEMGVSVVFVEEQREPNGDFPTVKKPNPEEEEALQMGLALAQEKQADLLMATDPDADRLGIAVPDAEGTFHLITGNQLGVLLADYIFSSRKELGTMPEKPAFVKTIVTTELQRKVAESYGATCFDVLTGFKYIGQKIKEFETGAEGYEYLCGGEESYGYLVGTAVRDKDAVSAATMTAELALYHREQGKTLLDRLNEIWEEYGYYQEFLINKQFEGKAGTEKMERIMREMREDIPHKLAGIMVSEVRDYLTGEVHDLTTNTKEKSLTLPASNVIQYRLKDGSVITARPSGTEPKIKFYISTFESGLPLSTLKGIVEKKVRAFENNIHMIVG
ncbi:phospho-sugar mutase [Chitinivibrio alkaliphilus]|uniref:N-acetylglucosamine-1-P-mutase n=1 Tax=Chitinivibrio alkaliphilus ACht1 TaxID=1313304 RepID=U7D7I5_9BACT|nr:phospho-sugar mutase [Chitinivibrio alkaliphilus]ERP31541.1 N-acetylglucosamine-1-P-mutase [Chitinivibrio alkaliphilus ACht1]